MKYVTMHAFYCMYIDMSGEEEKQGIYKKMAGFLPLRASNEVREKDFIHETENIQKYIFKTLTVV